MGSLVNLGLGSSDANNLERFWLNSVPIPEIDLLALSIIAIAAFKLTLRTIIQDSRLPILSLAFLLT